LALAGIVGKPNAGKSTFFSAATLTKVEIANYPFTTIKPNRGVAYVSHECVCKEFGVTDEPRNSLCQDGMRLIPVELIDCAGLVPGAWEGRGLGNQFLDEIRRADCLMHIVDASGSTDIEGKACAPGSHDPVEDVRFLENELDMWILQILKRDWEKAAKKAESSGEDISKVIEVRLSGLAVRRDQILKAMEGAGLDAKKPTSWADDGLKAIATSVRAVSKPMLIASNKVDQPTAADNLERLRGLGYPVIPCCAEAELALRRAAKREIIRYRPGDSIFTVLRPSELTESQMRGLESIRERVLDPFGSTGVQKAIDEAYFKLLGMICVYPVNDAERLADHEGRVLPDVYLVRGGMHAREFAYMLHSDLGEGFVHAIDVRKKMRVGEEYVLKDGDVISIVCARRRG